MWIQYWNPRHPDQHAIWEDDGRYYFFGRPRHTRHDSQAVKHFINWTVAGEWAWCLPHRDIRIPVYKTIVRADVIPFETMDALEEAWDRLRHDPPSFITRLLL